MDITHAAQSAVAHHYSDHQSRQPQVLRLLNFGSVRLNNPYHALRDDTGVVKVESRTARVELLLIAKAQVAEKVRLPTAIRKERRVHFRKNGRRRNDLDSSSCWSAPS
ncbi:MAG TPA: hypothetical protein VK788_18130 [Terriglobales bacterium]|jgi:hypothetical protein|nr:hypothetical protein [Terriglobales bacterium]